VNGVRSRSCTPPEGPIAEKTRTGAGTTQSADGAPCSPLLAHTALDVTLVTGTPVSPSVSGSGTGPMASSCQLMVTVRPDPVRSAASGVIPSGICRSSMSTPAALTDPVRPGATSARAPGCRMLPSWMLPGTTRPPGRRIRWLSSSPASASADARPFQGAGLEAGSAGDATVACLRASRALSILAFASASNRHFHSSGSSSRTRLAGWLEILSRTS